MFAYSEDIRLCTMEIGDQWLLYHIVHICYFLVLFRRVKYVIIAIPTIAQATIKMDLITFHCRIWLWTGHQKIKE